MGRLMQWYERQRRIRAVRRALKGVKVYSHPRSQFYYHAIMKHRMGPHSMKVIESWYILGYLVRQKITNVID